jgi:hypothetical protein
LKEAAIRSGDTVEAPQAVGLLIGEDLTVSVGRDANTAVAILETSLHSPNAANATQGIAGLFGPGNSAVSSDLFKSQKWLYVLGGRHAPALHQTAGKVVPQ